MFNWASVRHGRVCVPHSGAQKIQTGTTNSPGDGFQKYRNKTTGTSQGLNLSEKGLAFSLADSIKGKRAGLELGL